MRSSCVSATRNSAVPELSPGVDQRADVGIAQRDDAVKGREHALEGLEILQPRDVGAAPTSWLPASRPIAGSGVGVLLGDRVGCQQSLPALVGGTASCELACAVARSAWAWRSCWSTSGVSISASSWPFFTRRADVGVPARR